ncbi:hypothetical protein GCM10027403_27250 [Arthrobacter tecti]
MVFGIGLCIGAGTYLLTGQAAGANAGPAVALGAPFMLVALGMIILTWCTNECGAAAFNRYPPQNCPVRNLQR